MPTPASFAIASSVTSGPSCENARTAISSSRSRLRRPSARSGRAASTRAGSKKSSGNGNETESPPVILRRDRRTLRLQSIKAGHVMISSITTPFGAQSTAAEVIAGIDLTGRRAIVTGGASGIGIETARALASAGADVTLAVRDADAASAVAEEIRASTGNDAVDVRPLDLADIASVRRFCADWT